MGFYVSLVMMIDTAWYIDTRRILGLIFDQYNRVGSVNTKVVPAYLDINLNMFLNNYSFSYKTFSKIEIANSIDEILIYRT